MRPDMIYWSPQAVDAYQSRRHRDWMVQFSLEAMQRGPVLGEDGHTVVIPSKEGYYRSEVAAFWKSKGFRWNPNIFSWTRDTRRPLDGKVYSPAAWLDSVRRKFYEFYPSLSPCDQKP